MNAFSTIPPTLPFLMLGAVSSGALYNLWVWLHRRSDTLHLWAAGWCAITGSYLVSHYVQLSSVDTERVVLGARLTWVCVLLALNGREAFRLEREDRQLLESFVGQAALAIRNASLYAAEGAARQAAERALAEVRRLQGMLPICSYCKKIRNDRNSWEQMESYISEHSHATFSHVICPGCRSTVVASDLAQWRSAR